MLSFGEEAEEDEKELAAVKQKIKSSHDVLDDPRLLKKDTPNDELVKIQCTFSCILVLQMALSILSLPYVEFRVI